MRLRGLLFLIIAGLTGLAAAPAFAQTCLDHEFSDDTEFFIHSNSKAGYRNFLFGDFTDKAIYWTSDVKRLIRYLQADSSEWRSTDGDWSNSALSIEFSDSGVQCNAVIDDNNLYVDAASGRGVYVRTLGRSERNRILDQLNDVIRMSIQ